MIVVDATKNLLVNVLEYHPFLIKPNNYELGEIFGVTLSTKEDVILYAKKLQEMGTANVLVSMAGDGAVLVAEDGSTYKSEAPEGKVKNSVGAGDSMVAGFLYGYLKSGIYEDAFYYGVCTGSASAFSENLATREEVDTLLRNIKTEHKLIQVEQKDISVYEKGKRGFMHGDSFIENQKYPMKPSSTSSCKRSIGNMALTSLLISELSKSPCNHQHIRRSIKRNDSVGKITGCIEWCLIFAVDTTCSDKSYFTFT